MRDEAAPRLSTTGAVLRSVDNYDYFECRGRNRVAGAKVSEHGKGNAVDVRSFALADGRVIGLTDMTVPKDLRWALRASACRRFTTVLGPGSDGYHEGHIHLDHCRAPAAATASASGTCASRRRSKSPACRRSAADAAAGEPPTPVKHSGKLWPRLHFGTTVPGLALRACPLTLPARSSNRRGRPA